MTLRLAVCKQKPYATAAAPELGLDWWGMLTERRAYLHMHAGALSPPYPEVRCGADHGRRGHTGAIDAVAEGDAKGGAGVQIKHLASLGIRGGGACMRGSSSAVDAQLGGVILCNSKAISTAAGTQQTHPPQHPTLAQEPSAFIPLQPLARPGKTPVAPVPS